jgi:hypothetical protein
VLRERPDLRELMRQRLSEGTRAHEVSYGGRLHVRAASRGVTLADADGRPDIEGWVEQALQDADVLGSDEWHSGRDTEPSA